MFTNRNDLRHCVTPIVTSKYKGQTKVIDLRLPVMCARVYSADEIPVFLLLTFDKDKCMPYSQCGL